MPIPTRSASLREPRKHVSPLFVYRSSLHRRIPRNAEIANMGDLY